jgi:hypothetical protein
MCRQLPALHRQPESLARQSITIDRATLAFWTDYPAAEVKPVWRRMRDELLRSTKLFVDETTAPVLDPSRGRTKKGYFWVLARDDRPWCVRASSAVVYSYTPGRGGDHDAALLQGYSGAANRRLHCLPQPRRCEVRWRIGLAQRRICLLLFGLARGNCLFEIFQSQVELVGIELFRTPAEVHALQLANQVAQSVVLTSELIAFFNEPRLLGPFGVALGRRCQHQRAQPCDVVGRISGLKTGIIASRQSRVSDQPMGESLDAGPLIKPLQTLSRPAAAA